MLVILLPVKLDILLALEESAFLRITKKNHFTNGVKVGEVGTNREVGRLVLPLLVGGTVPLVTQGSRSTTLGDESTQESWVPLVSYTIRVGARSLTRWEALISRRLKQPEVDRLDLAITGGWSAGA
ncbi:hypothetical protein Tco_0312968 [Tanacetum coccineum]